MKPSPPNKFYVISFADNAYDCCQANEYNWKQASAKAMVKNFGILAYLFWVDSAEKVQPRFQFFFLDVARTLRLPLPTWVFPDEDGTAEYPDPPIGDIGDRVHDPPPVTVMAPLGWEMVLPVEQTPADATLMLEADMVGTVKEFRKLVDLVQAKRSIRRRLATGDELGGDFDIGLDIFLIVTCSLTSITSFIQPFFQTHP